MSSANAKKIDVVTLPELTLSEFDIETKGIDPANIFEVKVSDEIMGPFDRDDLKGYLEAHPEFPPTSEIRQFGTLCEWSSLYAHPYFQRRKLAVIREGDKPSVQLGEQFIVLRDGAPSSPMTPLELQNELKTKKVMLTDQVSNDGGKTWCPLYKLPGFDRRSALPLKGHLPTSPLNIEKTLSVPAKEDERRKSNSALSGLAYLGYVKSGKAMAIKEVAPLPEYGPKDQVIAPDPVYETPADVGQKKKSRFTFRGVMAIISLLLTVLVLSQVYQYSKKRSYDESTPLLSETTKTFSTAKRAPRVISAETSAFSPEVGERATLDSAEAPSLNSHRSRILNNQVTPQRTVQRSKRINLDPKEMAIRKSAFSSTRKNENGMFDSEDNNERLDTYKDRISPRSSDPTYGENTSSDIVDERTTAPKEEELFNEEVTQ